MDKSPNTAILFTDNGMVALDSPVKLKILKLLENGTKSFDELVENSNKAKSTISVHLHDLEELNLIQGKSFPDDKRKKYFMLNSLYLAYSETPLRNQYKSNLDNLALSILNGDSFRDKLFCTFRFGMEAFGIDPKPLLKQMGIDIGVKIGPAFKAEDCDGILDELSVFWEHHELGDMTSIDADKLTLVVNNCHHCSKMPNVGKTLCSMDEGIIEGVFSSKLDRHCHVKETECWGTGYHHCKFVVERL